MKKLITCLLPVVLLSGCAGTDLAALNKKISDGAQSLNDSIKSTMASSGMPLLSPASKSGGRTVDKTISIPVDVDTAAARIKRNYKFMSNGELNALSNRDNNSAWVASAISDAGQEWDAMPGSYYKMGSDWGDNGDHLTVEIEKNGAGSKLIISYRSASEARLKSGGVERLMNNIRSVATGNS